MMASDPKQELFATARVRLTVEVDAATWQIGSSAEQIFNAAGREAEGELERLIQESGGRVRIVGKPEVTLVTGVRK
jgi:hypothetical protein